MNPLILQFIGIFAVGFFVGVSVMLIFNKLKTGAATASGVRQEYDDYKEQVESHFEETSKKFQQMTEQYQDLYQHLAVGATSLCRPDSLAASLADSTAPVAKLDSKPRESASIDETTAQTEPVVDNSEQEAAPQATDQAVSKRAQTASQDKSLVDERVKDDHAKKAEANPSP